MKQIVFLIVLFTLNIFASKMQVPYTLENLKKINFYYIDKSGLFTKKEQVKIREKIKNKLIKTGFDLQADDPSTLIVMVDTIDVEDTIIANISILVGEDVITKRDKNIETLALTFHLNKFEELDEPKIEIVEYLDSMIGDFLKLYKEDME